ncbi:Electron transfer flavoprotein-ubiquinone oxidoreductase, mitochondrial [Manis javanica]|nr:Electron transfer flavoprotein-ubiquinone oxidoreductase, mitochondrial [Manis javanica]
MWFSQHSRICILGAQKGGITSLSYKSYQNCLIDGSSKYNRHSSGDCLDPGRPGCNPKPTTLSFHLMVLWSRKEVKRMSEASSSGLQTGFPCCTERRKT